MLLQHLGGRLDKIAVPFVVPQIGNDPDESDDWMESPVPPEYHAEVWPAKRCSTSNPMGKAATRSGLNPSRWMRSWRFRSPPVTMTMSNSCRYKQVRGPIVVEGRGNMPGTNDFGTRID